MAMFAPILSQIMCSTFSSRPTRPPLLSEIPLLGSGGEVEYCILFLPFSKNLRIALPSFPRGGPVSAIGGGNNSVDYLLDLGVMTGFRERRERNLSYTE